ncbi:MAG: Esterase/lipase [uncultured Cytophagales bacterium]|uniref:Esterase/lipase n=1 Tax=uncultured Cytophagales bacterium TaxID=158755 RepID=A0A6J4HNM3_9SPHI|nr:MAG: Esterase/lipase [uncultured Cytophagales bacterium]
MCYLFLTRLRRAWNRFYQSNQIPMRKMTYPLQQLGKRLLSGSVMVLLLAATACKDNDAEPNQIRPTGPKPEWAPNIDGKMQAVIEQLQSYGTPPLESLTPGQARQAPSPTNAVMDLLRKNNISPPAPAVTKTHQVIPSPAPGGTLVRIYTPQRGQGPFPVVVYYHGGGWVIANLDTYEPSAAALAEQAEAIVVSVAYRQAPENKFPAAHEDSYAAYQWALSSAASINGDPGRVAVAGESAGGNLASAVSMMARDRGIKVPVHQLLVYPIANTDFNTPSYNQYANAKPLGRSLMQWFFTQYLRTPEDLNNPLIALVKAPNVAGLPPATIITAQIDPLQSEGQQYADKLKAAGIPVTYQNYEGVTHEFFGMAAVVDQAKQAQALAAGELKKAFNTATR